MRNNFEFSAVWHLMKNRFIIYFHFLSVLPFKNKYPWIAYKSDKTLQFRTTKSKRAPSIKHLIKFQIGCIDSFTLWLQFYWEYGLYYFWTVFDPEFPRLFKTKLTLNLDCQISLSAKLVIHTTKSTEAPSIRNVIKHIIQLNLKMFDVQIVTVLILVSIGFWWNISGLETEDENLKRTIIEAALNDCKSNLATWQKLAIDEFGLVNGNYFLIPMFMIIVIAVNNFVFLDDLRRRIWPLLLEVDPDPSEKAPLLSELSQHSEYNQVVLDVNRSLKRFPPGTWSTFQENSDLTPSFF